MFWGFWGGGPGGATAMVWRYGSTVGGVVCDAVTYLEGCECFGVEGGRGETGAKA